MKYISIIGLLFVFLIGSSKDEPIKINLMFTNDLHGMIGEQDATFMNPEYPPRLMGGAAMYKYASKIKIEAQYEEEGFLMFDGGNIFQGTPFGIIDGGLSMIEWMNTMEYSASVPARYDFIKGFDNLRNLINNADFPFLGSNIECDDCEMIKPFIITEVKGIKIGILGIVDSSIPVNVLSKYLPGLKFTTEAQALEKWVPIVKEYGADIVILLTSSGVPWDRDEVYNDFLDTLSKGWDAKNEPLNAIQTGYYAKGIDIIISGGNSKGYPLPWYDPNSHVYVFQNYGNGTEFGHIKLLVDGESHKFMGYETVVKGRTSQSLLEDDFTVDYEMSEWIETRVEDANNQLYEMIEFNNVSSKQLVCNSKITNERENNWEIPSINLEDEIEIITWNCEFFPTAKEKTIDALSEAVLDLDADIYAFQEIRYTGWFSKLMEQLPNYEYIVSEQSSFMDQAIIFKKDMFQLVRQVEPFAENDYNYAGRPPLRADLIYVCEGDTLPFSIINLHMKCCDSGLSRRQKAVKMLHDYIAKDYESGITNFIVLGDWNDDLKDEPNAHCFQPFFDDDRFYFANQEIVHDISQASYPKEPYVSFLDHILVSESLVSSSTPKRVMTIPMDKYLGSFETYEKYISDHLPVLMGFRVK